VVNGKNQSSLQRQTMLEITTHRSYFQKLAPYKVCTVLTEVMDPTHIKSHRRLARQLTLKTPRRVPNHDSGPAPSLLGDSTDPVRLYIPVPVSLFSVSWFL